MKHSTDSSRQGILPELELFGSLFLLQDHDTRENELKQSNLYFHVTDPEIISLLLHLHLACAFTSTANRQGQPERPSPQSSATHAIHNTMPLISTGFRSAAFRTCKSLTPPSTSNTFCHNNSFFLFPSSFLSSITPSIKRSFSASSTIMSKVYFDVQWADSKQAVASQRQYSHP